MIIASHVFWQSLSKHFMTHDHGHVLSPVCRGWHVVELLVVRALHGRLIQRYCLLQCKLCDKTAECVFD